MASIPTLWAEHKNSAGRSYWYNSLTKESVWEKPDVLKTVVEKAMATTSWKESEANGKKYYYHKETKESKWEMPEEVKEAIKKAEEEAAKNPPPATPTTSAAPGLPMNPTRLAAPSFTPGTALQGANSLTTSSGDLSLVQAGAPGPLVLNGSLSSFPGSTPQKPSGILPARPNLPEDPIIPHNGFATYEEGEKAFFHLLRKAGVDATWTWEQTMRAIITDPLYKALNTLAERKTATHKFVEELKRKEQEEKEARLNRLRPALRNMLKGNPQVFHYTTFATADKLFSSHPIWQQARIEAERRHIFEDYVNELKQREITATRDARARSISKLMGLFKALNVDALTRWRYAYNTIRDSDEWNQDEELQKLPALDMLLAFEDFSRVSEREYEEKTRRATVEKNSKERKAREGFKELLQELLDQKKIKAKTSWKTVYPDIGNDPRYLTILGNPGSTPLELFWDEVDKLDQIFDPKVEKVETTLKAKDFIIDTKTTKREFDGIVAGAELDGVTQEDLEDIFDFLSKQAQRRQLEEQKRAERKQRRLQDDFRYALKKMDPPLDLDATYEVSEGSFKVLPEYTALDDEGRKAAFTKFVKRQKEKLREVMSEDGASTTTGSRKRKGRSKDHREPERGDAPERTRDRDREPDGKRHRSDTYDKRERDNRDRDHSHHDRDRDRYKDRERGRDYSRDRDKDRDRSKRDKDRDDDRDKQRDRDRDRGSSKREYRDHGREGRDRASKRTRILDYGSRERDDKEGSRYDRDKTDSTPKTEPGRDDTPEEGEI